MKKSLIPLIISMVISIGCYLFWTIACAVNPGEGNGIGLAVAAIFAAAINMFVDGVSLVFAIIALIIYCVKAESKKQIWLYIIGLLLPIASYFGVLYTISAISNILNGSTTEAIILTLL